MTVIDIKPQDDLFYALKEKMQQGLISNLNIVSSELEAEVAFKLKVYSTENSFTNIVEQSDGFANVNQSFTYNPDSVAFISQINNYNAAEYYNPQQTTSELSLASIYALTAPQFQEMEEGAIEGVFRNPSLIPSGLDMPSFVKISLNDRLDDSIIQNNKNSLPFYVNFTFTDTSNDFYKFLKHFDMYEMMVEAIDKTQFFEVPAEIVGSEQQVHSAELSSILSSIVVDPNMFEIYHAPSKETSSVWGSKIDQIDKMVFESRLVRYINENSPNYMQSLSGDAKPFVETLCYQINKFRSGTNVLLQTFYIPATDSNRNFIDSQVNYGSSYRYEVSSINVAFCNSYSYTTRVDSSGCVIAIKDKKLIRFMKIKLADHNHTITGIAPTKPEITFLNNSSAEKTIRIYFEPSIHNDVDHFTQIMQIDNETQVRAATDPEGKIKYKLGKDFLDFQIFKLNKKPTSYADFQDSLYAIVSGKDRSSSEVFEMFLTPNMKHYFTFRTRNNFNLFSNPTPIYEVELIQDSDESKIVSRIVKLEQDNDTRHREFGRFLRIYPAFDQLLLKEFNEGQDLSGETIVFNNKQFYVGDTKDPIWGKKFKFRIKSKNTGKVLDVNVDFNLKKEDSEADF